jgi:sugar phosphate isomerase/epimerase
MEATKLELPRIEKAFAAAQALGIPVINVGPGGKSDDEATLKESIATLRDRAALAAKYGVTLCVKAHVGQAIYNTPATLRAMQEIADLHFGIDMDPSHIFRAGLVGLLGREKYVYYIQLNQILYALPKSGGSGRRESNFQFHN